MKSTDKLLVLAERLEKKAEGRLDIESATNRINNAIGLAEELYNALSDNVPQHLLKAFVKRITEELLTAQYSLKPIHDDLD